MRVLLENYVSQANDLSAKEEETGPPVSFFEFWPGWLFYLPAVFYCLWLSLRYGGLTIPTVANPSIKNGGVVGESKKEILDLISKDYVASYTSVLKSGTDKEVLEKAQQVMQEKGFDFPIVAKPDNGCRGMGVQLLQSETDLHNYIRDFPVGETFLLQEYIDYESEAGVFYVRQPDEEKGQIISLTLKYFPYVTGDGRSTIKELVEQDERAGKVPHLYLPKLGDRQDHVLEQGERFRLVFSGSHCRGAIFKDGAGQITAQMEALFDKISKGVPDFYFGRFDVRFEHMGDLETGQHMKIIELNGATGEVTHIWDSSNSLISAYNDLFHQYKLLFEIGKKNARRGFTPVLFKDLWADYKAYSKLTKAYPATH